MEVLKRSTASLVTRLSLKEQANKAQAEWIKQLSEELNKMRSANYVHTEELRILKERYKNRELEIQETIEKMNQEKESAVANVKQQAQNEIQNMIAKNQLLSPSQKQLMEMEVQLTAHRAKFELYKKTAIQQQEQLKQKTIQECTEQARKDLENQGTKLKCDFTEYYSKIIQHMMTEHESILNELRKDLLICKEKEEGLKEKMDNQDAKIEELLDRIAQLETLVEEKEVLVQDGQAEIERIKQDTQDEIRKSINEAIESIKKKEYVTIAEHNHDMELNEKKFIEEKEKLIEQIKELRIKLKTALNVVGKETELQSQMNELIASLNDFKMDFYQDSQCAVCFDRPKNSFFIPCGHLYCRVCADQIEGGTKECAVCRGRVQSVGTLHD